MTLKVEDLDLYLKMNKKESLGEFFKKCHIGDTAALWIMTTHRLEDWMVIEIFNRLGVENAFRFICVGTLKDFFGRFAVVGGKLYLHRTPMAIVKEMLDEYC